mmetsp:Transcript_52704/g.153627  ORF Transcript_52704/g.153627 Transcript_52704/m.153627 type:complete len:258 (-) Transcript_52704:608-1381(-)
MVPGPREELCGLVALERDFQGLHHQRMQAGKARHPTAGRLADAPPDHVMDASERPRFGNLGLHRGSCRAWLIASTPLHVGRVRQEDSSRYRAHHRHQRRWGLFEGRDEGGDAGPAHCSGRGCLRGRVRTCLGRQAPAQGVSCHCGIFPHFRAIPSHIREAPWRHGLRGGRTGPKYGRQQRLVDRAGRLAHPGRLARAMPALEAGDGVQRLPPRRVPAAIQQWSPDHFHGDHVDPLHVSDGQVHCHGRSARPGCQAAR